MKAMMASPVRGRVPSRTRGVFVPGGRRDLEAEEVAAYLGKLRDLVPHMPRKKKLSKLEVIQRVIKYICELESTLEEDKQYHHHHHHHHHNHHQKKENIEYQEQEVVQEP